MLSRGMSEPLEGIVTRVRTMLAKEGKLPAERDLSDMLGVKRHTLRQGLKLLRDNGELQPSRPRPAPQKALKKSEIAQNTNPIEVWEVRLSIEPQIAREAARRGTPREIQAIRDAHESALPNVFEIEKEVAFHHRIAVASHNTLWLSFMELLLDITNDAAFRMQLPPFTSVTGYEHHGEILEAVASRDPAAAEAAMHRHLSAVQRWLMGTPDEAH